MTTHELAARLLALPDVPACVSAPTANRPEEVATVTDAILIESTAVKPWVMLWAEEKE